MANNRWISRNPDSQSNAQIACRLCNQVFASREALLGHIDSHLAHEEITLRSLRQPHQNTPQRETFCDHQFAQNFFRASPLMQETNRNVSNPWSIWASPPPQSTVALPHPMMVPPPRKTFNFFNATNLPSTSSQPPPIGFSSVWNDNKGVTTMQSQERNMEEMPTTEITRPFIDMLDKPIKKIEFIDLVSIDGQESGSQKLDLTLKL